MTKSSENNLPNEDTISLLELDKIVNISNNNEIFF